MKIRTLIVSILGVFVVSNVSLAQAAEAPEQEPQEPVFQQSDSPTLAKPEPLFVAQAEPTPRSRDRRATRQNAAPMATPHRVLATPPKANSPTIVKIFQLKYTMAEDLARLIESVFSIEAHQDNRMNYVIVNATQEQMESIESLIAATDVEAPEASTSRDVQNLIYRIYMFETSSGDKGMRSFSMILQTSSRVSSKELSVAAVDNDFQISEFLHINQELSEPQAEYLIRGKAASDESFMRFFEMFPESHITELKWDDNETFTEKIAAAQYTQLSEQMQEHISKFLGDEIRTVGYWFGNLSVPGEVEAPIGPWVLTLRLDTESDGMLELNVEVEVPDEMHRFDGRLGREQNNEILSNTIRAKIGKPIIIGYNRESYGTRKMGAMVIIPEVDMTQL